MGNAIIYQDSIFEGLGLFDLIMSPNLTEAEHGGNHPVSPTYPSIPPRDSSHRDHRLSGLQDQIPPPNAHSEGIAYPLIPPRDSSAMHIVQNFTDTHGQFMTQAHNSLTFPNLLPTNPTSVGMPYDPSASQTSGVGYAAPQENKGEPTRSSGAVQSLPPLPLSTGTGLLRNPPNLAAMRQLLFALPEPIVLAKVYFDQYWPYVSNLWMRNGKSRHGQVEYFYCRLYRKKAPETQGKGIRNRKIRDVQSCPMKLKIVLNHESGLVFLDRPLDQHLAHNHDLDAVDRIKRNEVLMDLAAAECAKGYSYADVAQAIRAPRSEQALIDAGGRHFGRGDVKNAGRQWRLDNPDLPFVEVALTGSCQCGLITYSSTHVPEYVTNCYCLICRKLSGAPFIPFAAFPTLSIIWTSGQERIKKTNYSNIAERAHCPDCGTPLYMQYAFQQERIFIPAGTIDEKSLKGSVPKPSTHLFISEKAGWYDLPEDGNTRHYGFPPSFQERIDVYKLSGK